MLELQILFLTLIPVFSGIVPHDGLSVASPLALFGIAEPITPEFMEGAWQSCDEFFKWGATGREKATLRPFRKKAFIKLNKDGTVQMVNLFEPSEGQWEVTDKGLILKDPRYPQVPERVIPIRKRSENRIWMLLPFSGGSIGIGFVRTSQDIPLNETQHKPNSKKMEWKWIRPTRSESGTGVSPTSTCIGRAIGYFGDNGDRNCQ